MTTTEVLQNLDNTITSKEILLVKYNSSKSAMDWIVADFLRINIDELKRIREDIAKVEV
jgi:hypothetical protein